MNKWILTIGLIAITFLVFGQQSYPLYPDTIPNAIPTDVKEVVSTNGRLISYQDVSVPTITAFLPKQSNDEKTAVIIIPGGGYVYEAYTLTGTDIGDYLVDNGVAAFILKYRLPDVRWMKDKKIGPIQDAQAAIIWVKQHAKEFGIDTTKIGVCGSSAGGHLAAFVSTHFKKSYVSNPNHINLRPDFSILLYPVISFQDSLTHLGSREHLIGLNPPDSLIKDYSNELNVSSGTPPSFLVHAQDDRTAPVFNSILYYEALTKYGVPSEMVIYPHGGHGFGIHNTTTSDFWLDRCKQWMMSNNWMSASTPPPTPVSFTLGNLLVVQVNSSSSGSSPISLNEYTTNGLAAAIHVIDPTLYSLSTANFSEGLGNLSENGNYYSLGVYNTPSGTQNVSSTSAAIAPRVILRFTADGTLDTVKLVNTFDASNIFGAVCDNTGQKFWAGGNGINGTGGLVFKQKGTSSAPTNITGTNLRSPEIYGGSLYISGNSGAIGGAEVVRLANFSTPLPEMTSSPINLNNSDLSKTLADGGVPVDIYQYVVADMDTIPGPDVIYVSNAVGSNHPGIKKYVLESGSWNYKYTISYGTSLFRGLTGTRLGDDVVLYAVADGDKILKVTDAKALANLSTPPTPIVLVTAGANQRFYGISFTPGSTISTPQITLTDFRVKATESYNQLSWGTTSEINVFQFIVEKSFDGKQFDSIGTVMASNTMGTHNYQLLDKEVSHNKLYYKLKIIYLNGTSTYSSIQVVEGLNNVSVEAFPNPIKDTLTINYPEIKNSGIALLYNSLGKEILKIQLPKGSNHVQQDVSNTREDIYILKIYIDGDVIVKKLIKE